MENELVAFGGYCKAIEGGRLVGPLVHFGSPTATDISRYRDYFTPRTNFDLDGCSFKSRIYYDHGLDPVIRKRRIGSGRMTKDAVAIWIEGQLDLRDEYMAGIYALAQRNKLSWSSGTAPHLVERKAIETASGVVHEVLSWPLGLDASVTPRPADPRSVVEVKSLIQGVALPAPSFAELLAEPEIKIAVDRIRESAGAALKFFSFPSESAKCGAIPSATVPNFTFPTWIHDLQATPDVPLLDISLNPGRSDAPGLNPFCRTDRLPEGWWNLYMQYAVPSVPAWWAESGYRYGVPWRNFIGELREQILRERAIYWRQRSGRDLDSPENLHAADVRFDCSVVKSEADNHPPHYAPCRVGGSAPEYVWPEYLHERTGPHWSSHLPLSLDGSWPTGGGANPLSPEDHLPDGWWEEYLALASPPLDLSPNERDGTIYGFSRRAFLHRLKRTIFCLRRDYHAERLRREPQLERIDPSTKGASQPGTSNCTTTIWNPSLGAAPRFPAEALDLPGGEERNPYHPGDRLPNAWREVARRSVIPDIDELRAEFAQMPEATLFDLVEHLYACSRAARYRTRTKATRGDGEEQVDWPDTMLLAQGGMRQREIAAPHTTDISGGPNPYDPTDIIPEGMAAMVREGGSITLSDLARRAGIAIDDDNHRDSDYQKIAALLFDQFLLRRAERRASAEGRLVSEGYEAIKSIPNDATKSRCDCGYDPQYDAPYGGQNSDQNSGQYDNRGRGYDDGSASPPPVVQSYPTPQACDPPPYGTSPSGGFTASGPATGTVGSGFGMIPVQPQPQQMICTPISPASPSATAGMGGYPTPPPTYVAATGSSAGAQPYAPNGYALWPNIPQYPWPPSGTSPGTTPVTPQPGTTTPPGTTPGTPPVVYTPSPPVQPPVIPPVFPPPPSGSGGGTTDGGLPTWVDFPYGPIPGYPPTPPPNGYTGLPYPWWLPPPLPPFDYNYGNPRYLNPGQPVAPNNPGGAWPDPAYFATPEPDGRWPGTFAETVGQPEYRLLRWLLWRRKADGTPLDPANPEDDWWWYWESIWYARGSREWYWLRSDGSRLGLKDMATEFLLRYLTHLRAPNRTPYLPWLIDAVEGELKRRGLAVPSGAPAPASAGERSPDQPPSSAQSTQPPSGGQTTPSGYPGGSTSYSTNNGVAMNNYNHSPQPGYTKSGESPSPAGSTGDELVIWAHGPGGLVPLSVRSTSPGGTYPEGFHIQLTGPNGPIPMQLSPVRAHAAATGSGVGDEVIVWGAGTLKATGPRTRISDELIVWATSPDGMRYPVSLRSLSGTVGEEVIVWANGPGGPIPLRLQPTAQPQAAPMREASGGAADETVVWRGDHRSSIKSIRGLIEGIQRGL